MEMSHEQEKNINRPKDGRGQNTRLLVREVTGEEIHFALETEGRVVLEALGPEDTFALGKILGGMGMPGQVVTLTGDLGAGKTVFAQGFAGGLGVEGPVNSPTFTILQVYQGGRLPFYHFDVYRIGDIEEMEETGFEDCIYGEGVCLIEWADLIGEILPRERLQVTLEREPEKDFNYRKITIEKRTDLP